MGDVHITKEMLAAAEAGELPWWRVARYGLAHLLGACPECEKEYQDYLDDLEVELAGDDGQEVADERIQTSVDRVAHRVLLMDRLVEAQKRSAEETVELLLRATPDERPALLHELAGGKPQAPLVGDLLLARAAEALPDRLDEAEDLVILAEVAGLDAILGELAPNDLALAVLARSLARQGDLERIHGRLEDAETLFARLHDVLSQGRVADPLALGEVSALEAALYRDQGQLEEAEELFRMAYEHYEAAASSTGMASALVDLAAVLVLQKRPEEAETAARGALTVLPAASAASEQLAAVAHYRLAESLHARGQTDEALSALSEAGRLLTRLGGHLLPLRVRWLEARIARARGEAELAEERLAQVRAGLGALDAGDLVHDTALVTLELADLLLSDGRIEDVRRVAWESQALYDDQRLTPEVRRALALFRRAAATERLRPDYLSRVLRFLEEARYAPGLAFDES